VHLDWTVTKNSDIKYFRIERSPDGKNYTRIATINKTLGGVYQATDNVVKLNATNLYYRILTTGNDGTMQYSKVIRVPLTANSQSAVTLLNNPVQDELQLNIVTEQDNSIQVLIYDVTGKLMRTITRHIPKGSSIVSINGFKNWAKGMYALTIYSGKNMFTERMLLTE
jgi:hypothetical protein